MDSIVAGRLRTRFTASAVESSPILTNSCTAEHTNRPMSSMLPLTNCHIRSDSSDVPKTMTVLHSIRRT